MDRGPIGAIQNLGVIPEYRGQGLGRALIRQAIEGFYTCFTPARCLDGGIGHRRDSFHVGVTRYPSVGRNLHNPHVGGSKSFFGLLRVLV